MNLEDICREIIKRSPYKSEAFAIKTMTFSVNVRNQEIESINKGSVLGIALRLMIDKKVGFSYASGVPDIDALIKSAADSARYYGDEWTAELPDKTVLNKLPLFDPKIESTAESVKIELAKNIEAAAFAYDKRIKNTESSGYSEEDTEIYLSNSSGFSAGYRFNSCGGFAQVIGEENGSQEEGYCVMQKKHFTDLSAEETGRTAAKRAVSSLGGKQILSQNLPTVFDPLVGAEFLNVISGLFSAENIRKGKSLLRGKTGRTIASKQISIIDDPLLGAGLASRPFDDEGTVSKELILIREGTMETVLHNLDSASKDSAQSTANAVRPSFRSLPSIGTSNLYIKPGNIERTKIISGISNGIYINKVMALHSVNPISGDFSLGACGFMIENGSLSFPVRGITIAGNLAELLMAIETVGNDLEFFPEAGACGSPTIFVGKLAVSGN